MRSLKTATVMMEGMDKHDPSPDQEGMAAADRRSIRRAGPIGVLVIEDDPVWQELLSANVLRLSNLALVGVAADLASALSLLVHGRPELLLLDIGLPDRSGFDLLATLPDPPVVVVTTGTPDHALQAFETGVTDMLVKPFTLERFLLAMDRSVAAVLERRQGASLSHDGPVPGFLSLGSGRRLVRIPLAEIEQVDAQGNHVLIHHAGRKLRVSATMKRIEEQLPADAFVRVHRCHIISRRAAQGWDGQAVRTADGVVPVGASYLARLMAFMEMY
jgi:two-component system LytT family response regulator